MRIISCKALQLCNNPRHSQRIGLGCKPSRIVEFAQLSRISTSMRVLQTVTFSYERYLLFVFLSASDLLVCHRLLSSRATYS